MKLQSDSQEENWQSEAQRLKEGRFVSITSSPLHEEGEDRVLAQRRLFEPGENRLSGAEGKS